MKDVETYHEEACNQLIDWVIEQPIDEREEFLDVLNRLRSRIQEELDAKI